MHNLWHDLVLAVVQGLTEFLPISSSAHLIFIPELFGWQENGIDFTIAVHLGTLTAVLYYFRSQLLSLCDPFNPLTKKLIIATLPVCIVGFLSKPYIELYLRGSIVIAFATIIFGLMLGYAQYKETHKTNNFSNISYYTSFYIGLAQCLALIPGTSRSGITISAALLLGLGRKLAAEFSFLLSIPVILLSSTMLIKDIILQPSMLDLNFLSYFIGFSVSALVAMISMYFFIKLVEKIGMMPFVIYRIILGGFLLVWFW